MVPKNLFSDQFFGESWENKLFVCEEHFNNLENKKKKKKKMILVEWKGSMEGTNMEINNFYFEECETLKCCLHIFLNVFFYYALYYAYYALLQSLDFVLGCTRTCSHAWWFENHIMFGAGELEVSPVTLYTKQSSAHKRCFIRHYMQDEMKMTSKIF